MSSFALTSIKNSGNASNLLRLDKNENLIKDESLLSTNKVTNSPKISRSMKAERFKKTRSLYAPTQNVTNYGPKATLKKINEDNLLLIQDPLSHRLTWSSPPANVLLIKKRAANLQKEYFNLLEYLTRIHKLKIYVEQEDLECEFSTEIQECIRNCSITSFKDNEENLENKVDLVICLGGDGTLLHVSSLFQKSCPPVLSFNMGSLGFLCPFDFENYSTYVDSVILGNVPFLLRNRLSCKILPVDSSRQTTSEWVALNEVVIHRGSSPYLSNLDLYINDDMITTVQGDGLIISSTTGSTAYSMSAGASMCHPSVPAIIICPICPHSLSFRPIIVPAGIDLKISLGIDARNLAWCTADSTNLGELKPGQSLHISSSEFPLPSICRNDQISDWFEGLGHCLHWNQRQKQLPLDSCYKEATNKSISNGHQN